MPSCAVAVSGLGRSGIGTLIVDGKAVQTVTMPMILRWDECFDVGSVTLIGVNDADYQPPFLLTATLDRLTIKIDRPTLNSTKTPSAHAGGVCLAMVGRLG